jgi:hypothetical protein
MHPRFLRFDDVWFSRRCALHPQQVGAAPVRLSARPKPAPPLGPFPYDVAVPHSADYAGACALHPQQAGSAPCTPAGAISLRRSSTAFCGLCRRLRPAPAAGGLRPLHPRWGHFISPDPLKFRSFSMLSVPLSCLYLAPAVRGNLPIGIREFSAQRHPGHELADRYLHQK